MARGWRGSPTGTGPDDPGRLIDEIATAAGSLPVARERLVDDDALACLPRERLEEWSRRLTECIRQLTLLRRRLDRAARATPAPGCQVCGRRVLGRGDKRYCSAACRQVAYRRRRAG